MAKPIDLTYLKAGRSYLESLRALGLEPDCLFWAQDELVGENVLVLVTTQYDRVGPLALSETLFKAHNLAGTPAEIDPFIVRMHSPEQSVIKELAKIVALNVKVDPLTPDPVPMTFHINGGGLQFEPAWIYRFRLPAKKPPAELARQWRRFNRNVDKLAA